jgi:hypothetical protein
VVPAAAVSEVLEVPSGLPVEVVASFWVPADESLTPGALCPALTASVVPTWSPVPLAPVAVPEDGCVSPPGPDVPDPEPSGGGVAVEEPTVGVPGLEVSELESSHADVVPVEVLGTGVVPVEVPFAS